MNAPGMGVGMRISFVVELKVKAISKVYKRYKRNAAFGRLFLLAEMEMGFERTTRPKGG